MNTEFYRENDDLVYRRGDSSAFFKRMDYAWRHVVDSTIYASLPDRDSSRPWFLDVFSGRFVYQKAGSDYMFVYELPEYLNQNFDPRYGGRQLLYRKETPIVIGEGKGGTKIQLPSHPVTNTKELYLWINGEPAWWGDERMLAPGGALDLETRRYNVVDADLKNGFLTIGPGLPANAQIEAWYHYHPPHYTYQGYKGKDSRFYYLDLNPTAGHVVTLESASGSPIDFYTNELLGKAIYLYLLPAYVLHKEFNATAQKDVWVQVDLRNKSVLRHSLTPTPERLFGWAGSSASWIAAQEGIPTGDVVKLLAEVTLSQNVALNKMSLIDTRSRGGGLRKDVRLESLGVEAQYCWDIGFWDGEPYHQNGVVVVRLPQRVLKEYGGLFSADQVRETVEKHLEFGNLALIEYLPPTTGRESLSIRENLLAPPASGGDTTPPASGGDTTPPASGGDTTPPASGGDTTPPDSPVEITQSPVVGVLNKSVQGGQGVMEIDWSAVPNAEWYEISEDDEVTWWQFYDLSNRRIILQGAPGSVVALMIRGARTLSQFESAYGPAASFMDTHATS